MCNAIFAKLADVDLPGFRKKNDLDIKFQVLDPSIIKSNFEGADLDVERKPDVGGLSEAALDKIRALVSSLSALKAPEGKFLTWWQILLSQEFKVNNRNNPFGKIKDVDSRVYKATLPVSEHSADRLEELDIPTVEETEETEELAQGSTGRKRTSTAAELGTGDGARPAKKQSPQASATGSTSNAVDSQGIPIPDKPHQKTVRGRVQCASYALEMMSYSAGVQHVINLLFTGTSSFLRC